MPPKSSSPSLPLKTRLMVAALSTVTDLSRRSNGTVNRLLLRLLDPPTSPSSHPIRHVTTSDIVVDPTRNLWFRLFTPTDRDISTLSVIVFFHGGGFAFLSPASRAYDEVCRRLARKLPALILSVNYRLSPEHKLPAPYIDGLDVLRHLDNSESFSSHNLSHCFLMGDSAGGNIAHHVARLYSEQHGSWNRVRLSGLIAIQPYFGGEERTESEMRLKSAPIVSVERTDWLWKAFLPEGEDKDHEAVNVFGPRDDGRLGTGFPRTMVVVGGWDPLQDWQRRYAEGLRRRGKEVRVLEYEDAIHAFYVFPEFKEAGMLIEEVTGFMESCNSLRIL